MKTILIVGATSAMAEATARIWAREGHRFFLAARDPERLAALAADLKLRGAASAQVLLLDVLDMGRHGDMVREAVAGLGSLDIALVAHGTLADQGACERDPALMVAQFTTNAVSTLSILTHLAQAFEAQGRGTLAVISSVAGDRGRPSNYGYGSAKAAVSTFCEGLHARLFKVGVRVVDIRPGFVATPMTAGLPLPALLVAQPDQVARRIARGIEGGAAVLYVPGFWRWIMLVVRCIPRPVFKRLNL